MCFLKSNQRPVYTPGVQNNAMTSSPVSELACCRGKWSWTANGNQVLYKAKILNGCVAQVHHTYFVCCQTNIQHPSGLLQEAVSVQAEDGKPSSEAAGAAANEVDDGTAGSPSVSETSATGLQLQGKLVACIHMSIIGCAGCALSRML